MRQRCLKSLCYLLMAAILEWHDLHFNAINITIYIGTISVKSDQHRRSGYGEHILKCGRSTTDGRTSVTSVASKCNLMHPHTIFINIKYQLPHLHAWKCNHVYDAPCYQKSPILPHTVPTGNVRLAHTVPWYPHTVSPYAARSTSEFKKLL